MKALVERHKDQPFAILGINTDSDKASFRKQAEQHGLTWRNAWQGSTQGPLPISWGVSSYPTIFVLDTRLVIRHLNARGPELARAVEQLLEEAAQGEREEDR